MDYSLLVSSIIGVGIIIRIVYVLIHHHLDKKLVTENK
jgi:hypothetical protein